MSELATVIADLERQRDAIERALTALREVSGSAKYTARAGKKSTRYLSPAAKKRIGAAQKKRWAEYRAGQDAAAAEELASTLTKRLPAKKAAAKKKRPPMSAEQRRKVGEASRARWAAGSGVGNLGKAKTKYAKTTKKAAKRAAKKAPVPVAALARAE